MIFARRVMHNKCVEISLSVWVWLIEPAPIGALPLYIQHHSSKGLLNRPSDSAQLELTRTRSMECTVIRLLNDIAVRAELFCSGVTKCPLLRSEYVIYVGHCPQLLSSCLFVKSTRRPHICHTIRCEGLINELQKGPALPCNRSSIVDRRRFVRNRNKVFSDGKTHVRSDWRINWIYGMNMQWIK